jgi:hypothetical protein
MTKLNMTKVQKPINAWRSVIATFSRQNEIVTAWIAVRAAAALSG